MQTMGPGLVASDLELCSTIRESSNKDDLFYKNSFEVVPNPTILFGTANHPVIFHYFELYDIDPNQEYILKTLILDGSGKPIQENVKKRRYKAKNSVEIGTTSVAKLVSGRYRLQVLVLSQSSEPMTRVEKTFYVYNPQVAAPVVSDAKLVEAELGGLTSDELAEEFRMAQYHATQDEINMFARITSVEGRREFLSSFWAEVTKGRAGRAGITRVDYLERVRKANERFRAFGRPGWQTDRGRVLIIYGDPNDTERHPSTTEVARPYELWHYFDIESGVAFVFVDRTGFGDYTLVHSTKRGELWDDQWQRLLQ
jgi:GWxTD domain-containing protein